MAGTTSPLLPVIDAHHHIWRQADLPWLTGPMQPRIFGPYEPIRRDYPISEYLADIAGQHVVGSVYVQANWPRDRAEDEVRWVSEQAKTSGYPQAIVGYCDLTADDAPAVLRRLAAYPAMRGVRMQLHWHENPMYCFESIPDRADDPAFRRHLALLQDHGWSFDLQVFSGQMEGAARLAADFPGIAFMLQHAGMPEDMSPAGQELWQRGLARLADLPNVFCKLSGLGTFIHANDREHIAAIVQHAVAAFGPARCLYGSNFPIEKLWTDYPALLSTYREIFSGWPRAAQQAMLHDTAKRLYRL